MKTKSLVAQIVLLIVLLGCAVGFAFSNGQLIILRQEVQGLRKQAVIDRDFEKLVVIYLKKIQEGSASKEDSERLQAAYGRLSRQRNDLFADPKNRLSTQSPEPAAGTAHL